MSPTTAIDIITSHLHNLLVSDSAPPGVPRGPTAHNAEHAKRKNQTCEQQLLILVDRPAVREGTTVAQLSLQTLNEDLDTDLS